MTTAQRRVTAGFGLVLSAVIAWGLGTYAWLYYQDATAPPGVLSERAFLTGLPNLILAALVSVLLTAAWGVCYFWLRGDSLNASRVSGTGAEPSRFTRRRDGASE